MEAVRRVCKAWPLAPLEGTRAGTLARRAAVEWQSASDNVANHIMKDWPAETAAVAIAAAYAPKLEPGERIATASEDSLSDNTQSEEGSESEDEEEVLAAVLPLRLPEEGEDRPAAGGGWGAARRESRLAGVDTLWVWRWSQAHAAVASVVASVVDPKTYRRPEGWAAEFVGVLCRVLLWPAVRSARPQHLAIDSEGYAYRSAELRSAELRSLIRAVLGAAGRSFASSTPSPPRWSGTRPRCSRPSGCCWRRWPPSPSRNARRPATPSCRTRSGAARPRWPSVSPVPLFAQSPTISRKEGICCR